MRNLTGNVTVTLTADEARAVMMAAHQTLKTLDQIEDYEYAIGLVGGEKAIAAVICDHILNPGGRA